MVDRLVEMNQLDLLWFREFWTCASCADELEQLDALPVVHRTGRLRGAGAADERMRKVA